MPIRPAQLITDPVTGVTYDCLAVSLAVSPSWSDTAVSGAMSLYVEPYGVDAVGQVLRYPAGATTIAVHDIFARAASDPVFAAALGAMMGALQEYLYTAGV